MDMAAGVLFSTVDGEQSEFRPKAFDDDSCSMFIARRLRGGRPFFPSLIRFSAHFNFNCFLHVGYFHEGSWVIPASA